LNYLLDTNVCIALINDNPVEVRRRAQKAAAEESKLFVSSVASFELWYGVRKSLREDFNSKRLEIFFAGPVLILPFEGEDAKIAGAIRATLEQTGKPIGAYDLLIAGQAVNRHLTLVTANVSEFARVKGLKWQDWAKA
jgi:tRNA(fMet)-specific endonuclease VapC